MIDHATFEKLHDVRVLLRAHGEPPSTYETARRNNITLVDATCPVVLNLQKRIRRVYHEMGNNPQIVIYGKHGHAEVLGLVGQTNSEAIVIADMNEIDKVDLTRNTYLFSQTTKPLEGFQKVINYLTEHIQAPAEFKCFDTICRSVSNRLPAVQEFARNTMWCSSFAVSKVVTDVCSMRLATKSMSALTLWMTLRCSMLRGLKVRRVWVFAERLLLLNG